MKVELCDGRIFNYDAIEKEEDLKTMSEDDLYDLYKDVIDEREGYSDMDDYGLILDEVFMIIDNELRNRKEKKYLNNNFLALIIDNLEDWLDEKGVRIPNEERDREDPENGANIYGEDFDQLMEMIRDVCIKNEIYVVDEWE